MTIEEAWVAWWEASGPLTEIVTGKLWRDQVPEENTDGTKVELPFARYKIVTETQTDLTTAGDSATNQFDEELLIQTDIWTADADTTKQARDVMVRLFDRFRPQLTTPESFVRCDRQSSVITDDVEHDGTTIWRAIVEHIVIVQRNQ